MRYFQLVFRAIGWLFVTVGLPGTVGGLAMLFDPDATIEFNGVPTRAIPLKLVFVGLFTMFGCAGATIVRGCFDPITKRLTRFRRD